MRFGLKKNQEGRMNSIETLNPFAKKTWARLITQYPSWGPYFGTRDKDDLEVAVPAPLESNAGHLVIFTTEGKDLWVRFSAPYMCYAIDDLDEVLSVIKSLLNDEVWMVTIIHDGEWVETSLLIRGQDISLKPGQIAQFLSWSGRHDKTLTGS